MGTRLRSHCGATARTGPVLPAWWLPWLWLPRAQDQLRWGWDGRDRAPSCHTWGAPGLLGLWLKPWRGLGAPRYWHLGPGTLYYQLRPAGRPGMWQGSAAAVTFPFPSRQH